MSDSAQYIKLTLSFHHRNMLKFIAEHGGRVDYQFDHPFVLPDNFPKDAPKPTEEQGRQLVKDSDDSIRQMEKMGVIKITPIIGHGKHLLELTDIGRNVIEQMKIRIDPTSGGKS